MSGSTNAGDAFDMTATRTAAESTYAGIVRLVEAAQAAKAPMVRLADRYAVGFLALTVALGCVSWVFFRAESIGAAWSYLAALFGAGGGSDAALLVGAVTRHPAYLAMVALAAVVVWCAPQAADWTRRLTPLRMALCLTFGIFAVAVMTVEEFNPFIYFIF